MAPAPAARRILLDVYVAYQLAGGLIEHELADSGIAAEDYALYSALGHGVQVTPTWLSRELGLPLSTVIFRTNRLIQRGHALRIPNPRDRRSTLIALTPRGERLSIAARPAFERVLERLERHLGGPLGEVQATVARLGGALADALAEARDEELVRRKAS